MIMETFMKAILPMESDADMVFIHGVTVPNIPEDGLIINVMAMEQRIMLTEVYIVAIGFTTKETGMENLN